MNARNLSIGSLFLLAISIAPTSGHANGSRFRRTSLKVPKRVVGRARVGVEIIETRADAQRTTLLIPNSSPSGPAVKVVRAASRQDRNFSDSTVWVRESESGADVDVTMVGTENTGAIEFVQDGAAMSSPLPEVFAEFVPRSDALRSLHIQTRVGNQLPPNVDVGKLASDVTFYVAGAAQHSGSVTLQTGLIRERGVWSRQLFSIRAGQEVFRPKGFELPWRQALAEHVRSSQITIGHGSVRENLAGDILRAHPTYDSRTVNTAALGRADADGQGHVLFALGGVAYDVSGYAEGFFKLIGSNADRERGDWLLERLRTGVFLGSAMPAGTARRHDRMHLPDGSGYVEVVDVSAE